MEGIRAQAVAGFDVHFDAYAKQHLPIVDHTDRVFRRNGTVPDDMKQDGTRHPDVRQFRGS